MNKTDAHTLDTCGYYCPEPVMMLHSKIRDLAVGDELLVMATDPATRRDIPKFCHFLGHDLVEQDEIDGTLHYRIRKAC